MRSRPNRGTRSFLPPPDVSCDSEIFWDPEMRKGGKALEGSQKMRVPENRKSAEMVGEFAPAPGPGPGFPIILFPEFPMLV